MSRDVLLFASQGSSTHMANSSLLYLDHQNAGTTRVLGVFLQRCLEAFHTESQALSLSLSPEEAHLIGPWATVLEDFNQPETLLSPMLKYRSNAVIESTTFYTHQVLDLFLYLSSCPAGGTRSRSVAESRGVCSGMLPAVLAAAFPSGISTDLLDYAVEAFRLAFWIGVRTSLFCHESEPFPDVTVSNDSTSWALTVKGCSLEQLQAEVDAYNSSQSLKLPVRTSIIFSDDVVSLVGNPIALLHFKEKLSPPVSARFPHVHGYYHGGCAGEKMQLAVIKDIERREIAFPTWDLLHIPFNSANADENITRLKQPLVEIVLRSIFVDTVNWNEDWQSLHTYAPAKNIPEQLRMVLLGPNTSSLRLASFSTKSDRKIEMTTNLQGQKEWTTSSEDIAIVGMSVNFPLGDSAREFWESLKNGVNTVSEIPSTRFNHSRYSHDGESGRDSPRSMSVRHGNFITNPFAFDNAFWNISPREAKSMDPQQRLLLQASLAALEDAGYAPDSTPTFQRETFGVFVGVATSDYTDHLRDEIDVYYSPGTLRAFLSGRISYAFDFQGPSMVLDSACSSSLVAIHQACKAIQRGECTAALAGGVNVISSPDMYLGLARAHFLSETGQCKPFDEAADGYCRSEGCGVVVLKRVSHALDEGDRILGVIRGTELNQSGKSKSITHPDYSTQAALFRKLLASSNLSPEMVSVVEAHGTGTQAGDYSETRSLRTVFGPNRSLENPLYVSSVKGNMGHAEAASGVAGLVKLLLEMKYQQIPRQASLTKLNPRLDLLPGECIVIPQKLYQWNRGKFPRRIALLNNFGAAGSNAALILEEPPEEIKQQNNPMSVRSCHILNISAKSKVALEYLREHFILLMDTPPSDLDLSSLCYSATARKSEYAPYRVSVTGKTMCELSDQLRQTQVAPVDTKSATRKTIFVFSGQGSVNSGMGEELMRTCPLYSSIVKSCDELLAHHGFPVVSPYLMGNLTYFEKLQPGDQIIVSQCSCFILEYALARTWMSWGILPDLVLGHSLGEYAAFAISSILTMTDGLLFVARRASLLGRLCQMNSSGMVACRLSSRAVRDIINTDTAFAQLEIVCINSPNDTVVSGPLSALGELIEACQSTGAKVTKLNVPIGYHSAAVEPILDDFRRQLSAVKLRCPVYPVGSTMYGRIMHVTEHIPIDYFANQARNPIEFCRLAEDVAQTYPEANLTFLEIGPSPTTISKLRWIFPPDRALLVSSLSPKEPSWLTLSKSLQALYLQAKTINWRGVYAGSDTKFIDYLPRYPLNMSSTFVIPFHETIGSGNGNRMSTEHDIQATQYHFLESFARKGESRTEFESNMASMVPYIEAHKVGNIALCPASVHVELALEALHMECKPGAESIHTQTVHTLEEIDFQSPLVLPSNKSAAPEKVSMILLQSQGTATQFMSSTRSHRSHCTGSVLSIPQLRTNELLARKSAYVQRQMKAFLALDENPPERFSSETIYNVIFPRVVTYSTPLETLRHIQIENSGLEARGVFRVPHSDPKQLFVCHPAFVDTILHTPGFVANFKAESGSAYICSTIDRLVVPTNVTELQAQDLQIYCSLVDLGESVVAESYVLNSQDEVLAWAEGIKFKKLSLRSFKAYLTRISDQAHPLQHKNILGPQADLSLPQSPVSLAASLNQTSTNSVQSLGTRDLLHSIVLETCGLKTGTILTPEMTLDDLGIDSLLLIELSRVLKERFPGTDIDGKTTSWQKIEDLESSISKAHGTNSSRPAVSITSDPGVNDLNTTESSTSCLPSLDLGKPKTDFEKIDLTELFREVFGLAISDAEKHCSLGSLGVDSLGAIELLHEIKKRWGTSDLGNVVSISELTFLEVEKVVQTGTTCPIPSFSDEVVNADSSVARNIGSGKVLPVHLNQQVAHFVPFYLFHDGSGGCSMYSRLSVPGHNLLGIHSLEIGSKPRISKLEKLASMYIDEAGLLDEERPMILGGWSFGGVVAIETAQQLRQHGKEIIGVVLIDSPAPVQHETMPNAVIQRIVGNSESRRDLVEQFHQHAKMLQNYNPQPLAQLSKIAVVLIQCTQSFDTGALCGVKYAWLESADGRRQNLEKWSAVLGASSMLVLDLDCHHFEVFGGKNVDRLSELVAHACRYLEGKSEGTDMKV